MPLNKGFLRQKENAINTTWISTGIIIGLFTALLFYTFSIQFREIFRVLTYDFVDHLLILNRGEILFYDAIYAFFSSVVGCSFGLRFILQNSRQSLDPKLRLGHSLVIHNNLFYTWHTLNWLFKWFVVIAILYITLPMHFDLIFSKYWFVLIMFIVSWFLYLWIGSYRILGSQVIRWILYSFFIVIANSFALNLLHVVDYDSVNAKILARTIQHNYIVGVPESDIYQSVGRRQNIYQVYVGYRRTEPDKKVKVVIKRSDDARLISVPIDSLGLILKEEQRQYSYRNWAYDDVVMLHIDGSVKMKWVVLIKEEIRKHKFTNLYYSVTPKHTKYPSDYPAFHRVGIGTRLALHCPQIKHQVDSILDLGYKVDEINFPDHPCYRGVDIVNYNRVKLVVDQKQMLLNRRHVDIKNLQQLIFDFFNKYRDKGIVMLDFHENCSFSQYLRAQETIRKAILRVRNQEAIKEYEQAYVSSSELWYPENKNMRRIEEKIPLNILEMTPEDVYLYDLIKKAQVK